MRRIQLAVIVVSCLIAVGAFSVAVRVEAVQDMDGDGIPDLFDNCTLVYNSPNQPDSNIDGFGNACDPDLNDDLLVDENDLPIFGVTFGFSVLPGEYAATDFDGDGVTGIPDAIILRAYAGGPPGPSGLSCAGTPGCQ